MDHLDSEDEAASFFETLFSIHQSTLCHIPEDLNLWFYCVVPSYAQCMSLRTDLYVRTFCSLAALRFRFRQHGYENKQFCREFHVSSEYYIPELFYDCLWTKSDYEGTHFTFEYEAEGVHHIEARRYVTLLPFYKDIGMSKCKTAILYM